MNFSLTETKEIDGYVYRTGLIFREGDYQDKKFTMTPEELLVAESEFEPAPIDIEHIPSIFDGKLGKLQSVKLSEDGRELFGTAVIPKWLHEVIGDEPVKVSCTWDRESKKLQKLALVRNPRVSDAAMMAAFSKDRLKTEEQDKVVSDMITWFADSYDYDKTHTGQSQMQQLHHMLCMFGAVCDEDNENSDFASKKENKAIQDMHDMSVKHGASCDFKRDYSSMYSQKEGKTMKVNEMISKMTDAFSAAFKADGDAEVIFENDKNKEAADEVAALKAKVEALEQEKIRLSADTSAEDEKRVLQEKLAALEQEKLVSDSQGFASEQVKRAVIAPAMEADLANFYLQVASDDKSNAAEVAFSKEGTQVKGNRLDALKALFSALKPNKLTDEEVIGLEAGILHDANFSEDSLVEQAEKQAAEFAKKYNRKTA